jgi:hypothetical protein
MTDETITTRLEELRAAIRAESISYGEIAELQGLAEHVTRGDVELAEWAGIPEPAFHTADQIQDSELRAAYLRGAMEQAG